MSGNAVVCEDKQIKATSGKSHADFDNNIFRVNKNPTICNSMQIFIHCKVTLHVSGVTAPIIGSTKNCNRNLRYRSYCKTVGLTGIN